MQNKRPAHRGPGGPHGRMSAEKAADFSGTMKKLFHYLKDYRAAMLAVMLLAAGSAVFAIVGPRKMGDITTEIFAGLMNRISGSGGIDFAAIGRMLLGLLGLYLISSLLSFLQHFIMTGVSQRMSYRLRREMCHKINLLPMKYYDKVSNGEVLSRFTNDVDTLGQSLSQSLSQVVSSVATAIGVLVMMLAISWQMTLLALTIVPLSAILMGVVVKHSQKYFIGQQRYLGELNGQVEEIYAGHTVVKAYGQEDRVVATFEATNAKLYRSGWKSQFLSGLMQPIMGLVGNLAYVCIAIAGGLLAAGGSITVGNIQSFIQYVRMFNQPISQIAQVANLLQSTAAAAERVFSFLEEEEEDQSVADPVHIEGLKGRVTFDHVRFGYDPEKIIIKDFSCDVQPGQMVAIVGPTGAGKTTMVKLLMRFYDVLGGTIRVDGHDVRQFDRSELRDMFGMVLQDTWLFHGTIAENIRYGRLSATDEEVVAAAKAAKADKFIRTLPGGYDMVLNEEATNVSQGQKQLLTIARALLADPPILILDEATSSVDTRTERQIQQAMQTLMKGRTSFVIAHRLSTIRDADLILVMKDGDIIETGTHDHLLAQNGFYAQLYNAQFEE